MWILLGAVAIASPVCAQSYPSNIIHIVVAGVAGTPPDIIARIVAAELGESEGWRVVVENKPGAVQTIGGTEVLKHPADGHSILSISLPASVAPPSCPT